MSFANLIFDRVVVGDFQCNCMLLGCDKTKEAVIVDPGDEAEKIVAMVNKAGMKVKYIVFTHAHFDHILAADELKKKWESVETCLHSADEMIYNALPIQGQIFGFKADPLSPVQKKLNDEEILEFGEHKLQVIHTPGHSPGSVCYKLLGGNEDIFCGDTLFQGSVGRSDLWGGNHDQLIHSIKSRLLTFNDDISAHPGHGPSTKLGIERRQNPFLR